MNRAKTAVATLAASALVLAGCASDEDEVRLAEPVLDFPYTSTTAAPTPTMAEPTEIDDADETTTSTSATSTTQSSTKTSTSTSTKTSTSTRSASSVRQQEPAPAPAPANPEPVQPGAACAWPTQGEANGREFSTFCDREWARTMLDGQQYFWRANGTGWASIDPEGMLDGEVCWDRDEFDDAPEAIRNAAIYCEPAESPAN